MSFFPKNILTREELQRLAQEIGKMEQTTAGELRVVLRHHRHFTEWKRPIHHIALREFRRLGMHHTKDRTGVLIFFLISERKFHIIADEGIHKKVGDGTWETIAAAMSAHFKRGSFCLGVSEAIDAVGGVLAKHFPRTADTRNELPNDIIEEQ